MRRIGCLNIRKLKLFFYSRIISRLVLKVMEQDGQLARWIEVMSSFGSEIEYRVCLQHYNVDALLRRPRNDGCKWCK